jgi:hypothetical protein
VYLSRGFTLSLGKNNVQEIFGGRDNSDSFEVIDYHGGAGEGGMVKAKERVRRE